MSAMLQSTMMGPITTGVIPAMRWCGVEHAHGPHTWVVPAGMTGIYAQCPGSSELCGKCAGRLS